MKRIVPLKPTPKKPTCICYWCGAVYSKIKSLEEHQKNNCNPRNVEAGDYRFKHLMADSQKYLERVAA